MKDIPLLISSSIERPGGDRGKWNELVKPTGFIRGIQTNTLSDDLSADLLNAMVTGVPTSWARVRHFEYAFRYLSRDNAGDDEGMIRFYNTLIEEWKGLIGLIALYPDEIEVGEPITLNPKDLIDDDAFGIADGLGRMLFDDAKLWTDPQKVARGAKDALPFIQLIYFRKHLVGATSPFTLLFTATDYSNLPGGNEIPWYRSGKLEDPVKNQDLSQRQRQDLYLLTKNLIGEKFNNYEDSLNVNLEEGKSIDFSGFKRLVRKWRDTQKSAKLSEVGTLNLPLFMPPFEPLFEVSERLLWAENRFSLDPDKVEDPELVDPQELLLDTGLLMQFTPLENPRTDPVYYLPVKTLDRSETMFHVALPLSKKGINVFRNRMHGLLYGRDENKGSSAVPRLKAWIQKSNEGDIRHAENSILVELHLTVDGKPFPPLSRKYQTFMVENPRQLIIWPNFFHRDWRRYYVYSEFPENLDDNTKFNPIFRDLSAGDPGDLAYRGEMIFPSKEEVYTSKHIYLARYPHDRDPSVTNPYEIIRSEVPLIGFEVQKIENAKDHSAGYILLKDEQTQQHEMAYLPLRTITGRDEVSVGIDFGSNNSCIYSADLNGDQVEPINFFDHRLPIIKTRSKLKKTTEYLAEPHELYFFQDYPTDQGQIKSWLHEHNETYIAEEHRNMEIAGGVPIFKPLIEIKGVDKDNLILTNAGKLHHSMKWLTDSNHTPKQEAFLRTIWVHASANLFYEGKTPKRLIWSYPGSFASGETSHFRSLFTATRDSKPMNISVKVLEPMTEAEAVSNFAINQGESLGVHNLFLGIDVGGSSSDILVLAAKSLIPEIDPVGTNSVPMETSSASSDGSMNAVSEQEAADTHWQEEAITNKSGYRLMLQSSIRLSAGELANTVNRSRRFREAIYELATSPDSQLNLPNADQIKEMPNAGTFFFNAVVDKMRSEDEFDHFYNQINKNATEIFLLPAFITGVLAFYSGQLIGDAQVKDPRLSKIQKVDLFPFGKGGRIFDWLSVNPGTAKAQKYWQDCLNQGIRSMHDAPGGQKREYKLAKSAKIAMYKKSEVAMGLVETRVVEIPPRLREPSDVFGERGFQLDKTGSGTGAVAASKCVDVDLYEDNQQYLRYPSKYVEFGRFLDIFINFIGDWTDLPDRKENLLLQANQVLRNQLKGFIQSDSEYKKFINDPVNYPFRHPMIIMEALCYLDKVLIPQIIEKWKPR